MIGGSWPLVALIWVAGAGLLWLGWQWHPRNPVLDVAWGLVLYVVTSFYWLAALPIWWWVERWRRRRPDA